MADLEAVLDTHFSLAPIRTIVAAMGRGYAYDRQVRESFPDQDYAQIPAGVYRNRQVDQHLLRGVSRDLPGWDATEQKIAKCPHVYTKIVYGDLLLVSLAATTRRTVLRRSKERLKLAASSLIAPQQQVLLDNGARSVRASGEHKNKIFGVLIHHPDRNDRGRLGGLDLTFVSQAYEAVRTVDLIARMYHLAAMEVEPVQVEPTRIRIKKVVR